MQLRQFHHLLQIRKSSEGNQNQRASEREKRGASRQVLTTATLLPVYCAFLLTQFVVQPL
jgi:hypothetical protein